MRKSLCAAALACLFLLAGCGGPDADVSRQSGEVSALSGFVSGMGCSDPNCTDASHHHDCPADCTDYSHYHSCSLDCTEAGHHHNGETTASGSGQQHHKDSHH